MNTPIYVSGEIYIRDGKGTLLAVAETAKHADEIVHAVNEHEKLKRFFEDVQEANRQETSMRGLDRRIYAALSAYRKAE